jgi:hypothetical protein
LLPGSDFTTNQILGLILDFCCRPHDFFFFEKRYLPRPIPFVRVLPSVSPEQGDRKSGGAGPYIASDRGGKSKVLIPGAAPKKTVSEGTLAQKGLPFSENPAGTCRFAGISFLFSPAGTGQFSFLVG